MIMIVLMMYFYVNVALLLLTFLEVTPISTPLSPLYEDSREDCKPLDLNFDEKALQERRFDDYQNRPLKYCSKIASLGASSSSSFSSSSSSDPNLHWASYNSRYNFSAGQHQVMFYPPPKPDSLLYQANPPGNDVIMGISYFKSFIGGYKRFVGSLRHYKYTGHIILGVHSEISKNEFQYLKSQDVTMYAVQAVECDPSILGRDKIKGNIRGKCTKGLENLKMEWGRFELARRWLYHCPQCSGFAMVLDVRDTFFQGNPFESLGKHPSVSRNPLTPYGASRGNTIDHHPDLYFIEEISPYSSPDPDPKRSFISNNQRNYIHVVPCYGEEEFLKYANRPVLCSGTVIGSKEGLGRFLNVMVLEFLENNANSNINCKSPATTDQWTMNFLYYHGRFGAYDRTVTIPWGIGPVLTAGKACITSDRKTGAEDLIPRNGHVFNFNSQNGASKNETVIAKSPPADVSSAFDGAGESVRAGEKNGGRGGNDEYTGGELLNYFDLSIAPVVHQFDRCDSWVNNYMASKPRVYRQH